jgi:PP-loop superfamily ATP-utilizing enzyme
MAIEDLRHVVPLSGGKDSTALAIRLAELEPRGYVYVITPTGNELPEMFAHWRKLSAMLGSPLRPIHTNKSLQGLIREQTMLPNHRARWCTRLLKLEPFYAFMRQHAPCVSYVGLRADEENRPGMIFPEEAGITVRFPMREWGWKIEDVLRFLKEREIEIPERTDCAACFWQRIGEWYQLWQDHPEEYAEAEGLEAFVSEARGQPYTFRSPQRDSWPAGLTELRQRFEAGEVPKRSLAMMDKRREIGTCRICTL